MTTDMGSFDEQLNGYKRGFTLAFETIGIFKDLKGAGLLENYTVELDQEYFKFTGHLKQAPQIILELGTRLHADSTSIWIIPKSEESLDSEKFTDYFVTNNIGYKIMNGVFNKLKKAGLLSEKAEFKELDTNPTSCLYRRYSHVLTDKPCDLARIAKVITSALKFDGDKISLDKDIFKSTILQLRRDFREEQRSIMKAGGGLFEGLTPKS